MTTDAPLSGEELERLAKVAAKRADVCKVRFADSGPGDKARESHRREAEDFNAIWRALRSLAALTADLEDLLPEACEGYPTLTDRVRLLRDQRDFAETTSRNLVAELAALTAQRDALQVLVNEWARMHGEMRAERDEARGFAEHLRDEQYGGGEGSLVLPWESSASPPSEGETT